MCVSRGLALDAVSKFDEEPFLGDGRPNFRNKRTSPVISLFVVPVLSFFIFVLQLYGLVVMTSTILTYLSLLRVAFVRRPFVRALGAFCFQVTEPLLAPLRRSLPFVYGMDLSPLVLVLGGYLLESLCHRLILALL
jgi:YggT family protein